MKRIINTDSAPRAISTYSQGVEANRTLFIAGQIPIDPATGKFVEGGIKEQTEQVLKNIGAILKAAGYEYNDVVKITCMLDDMNNYQAMNEVYGKYYSADSPARAAFGVTKLPLGALIEMDAIAVKG